MIDGTTRLLLEKYSPTDPRLTEVAVTKSVKKFRVLMSASAYDDGIISATCGLYNLIHPELMSRSYQLPLTLDGIPVGSWIIEEKVL
ncbi:hypothetical protein ABQX22_00500 [Xanthomonas sp. WHRI 1810A]|uniref:hypothetical protein n=1 Tax=Xanthomonas sp. WHRI 1810A TaxID=3161565 RepID=UPI0032E8932F